MVVHHFRQFGRRIFSLYDSHPLMMNSITGGVVYVMGETITQYNSPSYKDKCVIDWSLVCQIGLLGSAENGILMSMW